MFCRFGSQHSGAECCSVGVDNRRTLTARFRKSVGSILTKCTFYEFCFVYPGAVMGTDVETQGIDPCASCMRSTRTSI
jgi:hypothetical protein